MVGTSSRDSGSSTTRPHKIIPSHQWRRPCSVSYSEGGGFIVERMPTEVDIESLVHAKKRV